MQNSSLPKPFPLHQQYVKAVAAAAESAPGKDDGEVGDVKEAAKPKPNKNKTISSDQSSKCVQKGDWQYSTLRKDFIAKQMKDKVGYQDAVSKWDSSNEKAVYLSVVPVGELKRRKFLKAGATKNPWYDQLNPS